LLELEDNPTDMGLIGRVFRALHTIKGSGAMFGFDELAKFTHEIENAFDLVRDGKKQVSKELISLGLAARDQIRIMLENDGKGLDTPKAQELIGQIRCLLSDESYDSPSAPLIYFIYFCPSEEIFHTGTNPVLLLDELRRLGECHIRAFTSAIPDLYDMNPESCYTAWNIFLTTFEQINTIKDVFIFVEDKCELTIRLADAEDLHPHKEEEGTSCIPAQVELPLPVQQEADKQKSDKREDSVSSIRVPAAKLDTLVNLVGEMVTVQARLSRKAAMEKDPELISVAEEVERLTASLRDNTMNIRMLPISTTFGNFKRLVRDLSAELGKEVSLITEGGETELDKTVIEKLNDPLIHIIRNAIDHGLEAPEVRKSSGKPAEGMITLTAAHSGAYVLIRISDDGAGLDTAKIRLKAVDRGLVASDTKLSESELYDLVFAPGLSTSSKITEVSGRGVGMDVVRRAVGSLRGTAEISSESGKGTTVTLRLPLTLAIVDGLLIEISGGYFILPLSVVEECVELRGRELAKVRSGHIMNFRDEMLPYVNLRTLFLSDGQMPNIEQVVIAEAKDGKVGLGVDRVIGQHQTVIKNLGKTYRDIECISGATILGDGTVALILDVPKLMVLAEQLSRKTAFGEFRYGG
jgi:two-component system chemotaxis sensor kinase CheA